MRKRIRLKSRPEGLPEHDNFTQVEEDLPALRQGEILIRNHYLALDPAIRGWIDGREDSYQPPVPLGAVVRSMTAGQVLESCHAGYSAGDWVTGLNAWEDYSVSRGVLLSRIRPEHERDVPAYLGILGAAGITAYFGLLEIGQPKPGQTVVVSSAAGAVGSAAAQIARLKGCRVVGIAGGPAKCAYVRDRLGLDATVDYRISDWPAELRKLCPAGIDIYFDNVGGPMLDEVLGQLARRGRVVLCGAISAYNNDGREQPLRNAWQLLVKSARMEGFLFGSYSARFEEARAQLSRWISTGKLTHEEVVLDGLEQTVQGFIDLFSGHHRGKAVVRVA